MLTERLFFIKNTGIYEYLKKWGEIIRPFAFTASLIPVFLAGTIAYKQNLLQPFLFLLVLLVVVLLHIAGNIINEYYDVVRGIDVLDGKSGNTASTVLLEKRLDSRQVLLVGRMILIIVMLGGFFYAYLFDFPQILIPVFIGVFAAYSYTAPPLQLKYHCLGTLLIFLTFGLILPYAVYFTFSRNVLTGLLWYFLPPAFLVTAIVHGNNLADFKKDQKICTVALKLGRQLSVYLYFLLVTVPYLVVIITVFRGIIPLSGLLVFISLPLACRNILSGFQGLQKDEKLLFLDEKTAHLHLLFGGLWIIIILFS